MKKYHLALAILAAGLPAMAIVPPSVYLSTKLMNTVGANPCIRVEKATGSMGIVTVRACSRKVGEALAFVLKKGNFKLLDETGKEIVPLSEPQPTPEFVLERLREALDGNRYFVKTHGKGPFQSVALEFRREVIQMWVDNLGDPYGNVNYVAADLFMDVLNEKYSKVRLTTTTSK